MATVPVVAMIGQLTLGSSAWVTVPDNDVQPFEPDCIYQVQVSGFDSWYTAAAVSPDSLLMNPYGSEEEGGGYTLTIPSASKTHLLVTQNGKALKDIDLGFESIRKWCPSKTTKIPIAGNSTFSEDCLYQVQEVGSYHRFQATGISGKQLELLPSDYSRLSSPVEANILSNEKNQTTTRNEYGQYHINPVGYIRQQCPASPWQKQSDIGTFNSDCLYRVLLDDKLTWQQAMGVGKNGFTLYISSYVPDGFTGTIKSIDSMSKGKYTRVRSGDQTTSGTVTAIEFYCP